MVILRKLGSPLSRSQQALRDSKEQLSSLPALVMTELTSIASLPTGSEKLATSALRKLAYETVSSEVTRCVAGLLS